MKNVADRPKGRTYEAPKAQIIEISALVVLCGSALQGNSTETVGLDYFVFP
jgi:hypothetical protein